MKRIIFLLTAIFMCTIARADEITINWMNTDKTINHTTTCTIGGDVNVPIPTKYGYTFNGWSANYIPIEYLESTGTQYIDTRIIGETGIKTKMKLLMTALGAGCALGSLDGLRFQPVLMYNSNWDSVVGEDKLTGSVQAYTIYITDFISNVHGYKFYVNDELVIEGETVAYNKTANMFMFTRNDKGYIRHNMKGRIYYTKIWQDDILVRDFIPVLDGNGVPCMYDKVENKFYYNQGTGQFIAGPVIGE